MTIENQNIQISSYELTDSAEAFTKAIGALSARTNQDRPEDILRYSFNVNANDGTAGAIIIYRDPESWLGQHDFAATLEEYQEFYKTIELVGLKMFGNLSPEICHWLDKRNISYKYSSNSPQGFPGEGRASFNGI